MVGDLGYNYGGAYLLQGVEEAYSKEGYRVVGYNLELFIKAGRADYRKIKTFGSVTGNESFRGLVEEATNFIKDRPNLFTFHENSFLCELIQRRVDKSGKLIGKFALSGLDQKFIEAFSKKGFIFNTRHP